MNDSKTADALDAPMKDELEIAVSRFQEAALNRDEAACLDLYPSIKRLCQPVIRSVQSRVGPMRDFLDEITDQALANALGGCESAVNFKGYYRRALTNQVISETRKRKRRKEVTSEDKLLSTAVSDDAEDASCLDEKMTLYGDRKRKIIDQLTLKPSHKLSTLLVDQRQRMSRIQYHSKGPQSKPNSWRIRVERYECWNHSDRQRLLASSEPMIDPIWHLFAEGVESQQWEPSQEGTVNAIGIAGCNIRQMAWRQRVSRYLRDVEEELDQQDWKYFLTGTASA